MKRPRRRRSRAPALLSLLAAVVAGALLWHAASRRSEAPPHPGAPSRAFSAALAAAAPPARWASSDLRRVRRALDETFADSLFRRSGLVVVAANGALVASRNGSTPLVPASTLKVVVGATALDVLGPHYRFETTFEALTGPHRGQLRGDLWLVGSGDPLLTSNDLRAGIARLYHGGVAHLDGGLIVDGSAFTGPEQNPLWTQDDLQYGYAAGTSAISLDQDTVEFRVTPTVPGAPATIRLEPDNTAVRYTGSIVTVAAGMGSWLHIDRALERNAYIVSGRIAAGAEQSFWRPVLDVPAYVAGVSDAMLRQRGIGVERRAATGHAPVAARTLWQHRSPPLADIVRKMMVESNNHIAEQLLRALGTAAHGEGSEPAGVLVEREYLTRLGVPTNGVRIVDGSGLSPANRVSAAMLATFLARVAQGRNGAAFVRSLPLAGREGTVRYHRLHAAAGRVRAKSGHLENVSGLAGYVSSRRHGRLAFAFIINDPRADASAVDASEDRLLDRLADF